MFNWLLCLTALLLHAAPLRAQSEAALKEYFEGKTVTLKVSMPGTEAGVDVYPGTPRPLDYPRHADRLKDFGTSIRSGEEAMVTKVKVKSKHIEFQLDGGGYGTMGDETSTSVPVSSAPQDQAGAESRGRDRPRVRSRQEAGAQGGAG